MHLFFFFDKSRHFPQALEFIQTVHATHVSRQTLPDEKGEQKEENEQREKQRILVHCAVGRSRSAAVVMAFMMVHLRMPLYDAFVKVKTMRDTVLPSILSLLALLPSPPLPLSPSPPLCPPLPLLSSPPVISFDFQRCWIYEAVNEAGQKVALYTFP